MSARRHRRTSPGARLTPPAPDEGRYRPELDGLRAVAVLAVLAYHLSPEALAGGYLGVDVFFVLSGYLISGVVWRELEGGRFTLGGFYERRVRRIVPALAVMLAAVVAVCCTRLLSTDLEALGEGTLAAALSVSNALFSRRVDYFAGRAETLPLLHTWSLAVEEQFYALHPLLLLLLHRRFRARTPALLLLLLAVALALSAWASWAYPAQAFYQTPFRAWELLLGGLLAVARPPGVTGRAAREVLAVLAWALVLGSMGLVDADVRGPLPGSLGVCLGAALLLHVSRDGETLACAPLRWRPAVAVGLISYSLYLWHWPLLALARYLATPASPSPGVLAGCVVAAFALAAASWRFVERPARAAGRGSRRVVFASAAAVLGALALVGVGLKLAPPSPLGPRAERLAAGARDRDPRYAAALVPARAWALRPAPLGAGAAPTTVVWGDSHAATYAAALEELARPRGRAVRLFAHGRGGVPPLPGVERVDRGGADGAAYHEEVLRLVESEPAVDTVVIAARWALYLLGPTPGEGGRRPLLVGHPGDAADPWALVSRGLGEVIARLRRAGKTVVLVGPTPEFEVDVPRALGLMAARGEEPEGLVVTEAAFLARQGRVLELLDAHAGPGVLRVNPHERLRLPGPGPARYRAMADGDASLYFDDDHLSLTGARFVAPAFAPVFAGR